VHFDLADFSGLKDVLRKDNLDLRDALVEAAPRFDGLLSGVADIFLEGWGSLPDQESLLESHVGSSGWALQDCPDSVLHFGFWLREDSCVLINERGW